MTLLSRAHLFVEAESDSELFQFWTRHCCQKLGIYIEVEFLSDLKPRLISSSKSMFRDQYQSIWFDKTLEKSKPDLLLN